MTEIEQGFICIRFEAIFQHKQFENKIFIDQFTFGRKVESDKTSEKETISRSRVEFNAIAQ